MYGVAVWRLMKSQGPGITRSMCRLPDAPSFPAPAVITVPSDQIEQTHKQRYDDEPWTSNANWSAMADPAIMQHPRIDRPASRHGQPHQTPRAFRFGGPAPCDQEPSLFKPPFDVHRHSEDDARPPSLFGCKRHRGIHTLDARNEDVRNKGSLLHWQPPTVRTARPRFTRRHVRSTSC